MNKMFLIVIIVGGYFGYDHYMNKGKIKKNPSGSSVPTELPSFETIHSVKSAYHAIPHRRTVFVSEETLSEDENYYLGMVLDGVDQAIVLRVTAYQSFSGKGKAVSNLVANYQTLLGYINSLEVPKGLQGFQERIYDAISLQGKAFKAWQNKGWEFKYHGEDFIKCPKIQKASEAIKGARVILNRKYPVVSSTTKKAFEDYLGALDFKK